MPARRLRHAGARRDAAADRVARDPDRHGRFDDAVAVRRGAALRLRRQLHLRRRRAAGRTPGAGARRSIRRSCASCSARRSCASCSTPTRSPTSSGSCSSSTSAIARARSTASTICCCTSAISTRGRDRRALDDRRPTRRVDAPGSRSGGSSPSTSADAARFIPVEYAARYRDALGVPLPLGLPESLLEPVRDAALDLARRYARTHGPFTTAEFAARYGLGRAHGRGAAEGAGRRQAGCSRESSGPAAPAASGATPRSCRRSAGARWRSCARRSSRSSRRCSPGSSRRGRASSRKRSGLDALLDAIENLQGAPSPRRSSKPRSSRRASTATTPPISTRSARPARSSGAASSRSAIATAASRSTSPITSRVSSVPALVGELTGARRGASSTHLRDARRVVLRRAPRGRRRRLSGRDGGRAVGSRVERRDHQRHLPRAARVHAPAGTPVAQAGRGRGPFRSRRMAPPSAEGRWSLIADRIASVPTERNGPPRWRSSCCRATAW